MNKIALILLIELQNYIFSDETPNKFGNSHKLSYLCTMKLSVIIPVYRVEATLDRCVESVLCQHVESMEVILVDDGSPDLCPQMCDEWEQKDKRIKVIHKVNGGLSDARNTALNIAQGDYITFVDSDDRISPNTYEPLLNMIGDCDMVEYSIANRLQLQDKRYNNADDYWLQEKVYSHTYAWNKIYRRELFDNVRYPKGKVFEDVYTLPLLLRNAKRIATSSHGYYHYTINPNGITATADGNALAQLLEAHLKSGMPIDDHYYMYLVNIQIDVNESTKAPIVLPYRKVNISSLPRRKQVKAIGLKIFGINILCKICKIIHLFKQPSRS